MSAIIMGFSSKGLRLYDGVKVTNFSEDKEDDKKTDNELVAKPADEQEKEKKQKLKKMALIAAAAAGGILVTAGTAYTVKRLIEKGDKEAAERYRITLAKVKHDNPDNYAIVWTDKRKFEVYKKSLGTRFWEFLTKERHLFPKKPDTPSTTDNKGNSVTIKGGLFKKRSYERSFSEKSDIVDKAPSPDNLEDILQNALDKDKDNKVLFELVTKFKDLDTSKYSDTLDEVLKNDESKNTLFKVLNITEDTSKDEESNESENKPQESEPKAE